VLIQVVPSYVTEPCSYGRLRVRKDDMIYDYNTRAYLVGVYETNVGTVTFIMHPNRHQETALMRHVFRTRLRKDVWVEAAGAGVAVRSEFQPVMVLLLGLMASGKIMSFYGVVTASDGFFWCAGRNGVCAWHRHSSWDWRSGERQEESETVT
jgi:hypothetical protein